MEMHFAVLTSLGKTAVETGVEDGSPGALQSHEDGQNRWDFAILAATSVAGWMEC